MLKYRFLVLRELMRNICYLVNIWIFEANNFCRWRLEQHIRFLFVITCSFQYLTYRNRFPVILHLHRGAVRVQFCFRCHQQAFAIFFSCIKQFSQRGSIIYSSSFQNCQKKNQGLAQNNCMDVPKSVLRSNWVPTRSFLSEFFTMLIGAKSDVQLTSEQLDLCANILWSSGSLPMTVSASRRNSTTEYAPSCGHG